MTAGGTTDFRHYIHAGSSTIIVSRKSTGVNAVFYVTRDHLNSSSAVTDSAGGILLNSSFDAFGKRRGSNWSGSPSASDWTAIAGTTRRGYTDHSMLDNLSLIHMGGRGFDPVLGRFVSADPLYEDHHATQSWNRYSYVLNSPLTNFDPSGFAPVDTAPDIVVTGYRGTYEQVGGIPIANGCAGNAACQSGLNGSGNTTAQGEAERRRGEVCVAMSLYGACAVVDRQTADAIDNAKGALAVAAVAAASEVVPVAKGIKYTGIGAKRLANAIRGALTAKRTQRAASGADNSVDGFRAVSRAEAEDVAQHGFRPKTGKSMDDKWFFESRESAEQFRRKFTDLEEILSAKVPREVYERSYKHENIDNLGRGFCVQCADLPLIRVP